MSAALPGTNDQWADLFQALDFSVKRFQQWANEGVLAKGQVDRLHEAYQLRKEKWSRAKQEGQPIPHLPGWSPGWAGESPVMHALRSWQFVEQEVHRFAREGLFTLSQSHALIAEARERQAMLERRLDPSEVPEALPVAPGGWDAGEEQRGFAQGHGTSPVRRAVPRQQTARRSLIEILLDPQNIQWLLAFGGGLTVIGLVILLWVNKVLTPPVVATVMGLTNLAVLACGWGVLRSTRFLMAGRALTLIACLVMPLNLWYYHANDLMTHFGLPALVMSGFYLASALILRDELFVPVFLGGLTLAGLLILADAGMFWQIAAPSTLLIGLGLLAIHAERGFPAGEGPFTRQRFGLASFWSGHALIAAGLVLIFLAQLAGDWLYEPVFKVFYQELKAQPSPICGELRWLAFLLVAVSTYAYIYSDVVVRRIGIYVQVAALTLLWSLVLLLELLGVKMGIDLLICVLALAALGVNAAQVSILKENRYTRALPILGVLLPLLAVVLGIFVYLNAISPDLASAWAGQRPSVTYIVAMLLTAVSCRLGAYFYRNTNPDLSAVYFFATAAATLMGAASFLAAIGLTAWEHHAPLLMLVPIAYVIAAHLYEGKPAAKPLLWVSHTATGVMLASSLVSTLKGFVLVQGQPLNLYLALFFAEAAIFYALVTKFYQQRVAIHLTAVMVCAAVWQLLTYARVEAEYYTLLFALAGLGLLVAYRQALVERFVSSQHAEAVFQSANALLSLSFVAAGMLGMVRMATEVRWLFVILSAVMTVISLLTVKMVRHAEWRRWYVFTSAGLAMLTLMALTWLIDMNPWRKLELVSVLAGLILLGVGHYGWYREEERESDLVTVSLILGSLLVGMPLALATIIDRSRDTFVWQDELGFLTAGIVLLTTGYLCRLKATTLTGAGLTMLYFLALLIYIPWKQLNTIALFITIGGGTLFVLGLLLSVYRDRLLALPEQMKRRQGLFRVLSWR